MYVDIVNIAPLYSWVLTRKESLTHELCAEEAMDIERLPDVRRAIDAGQPRGLGSGPDDRSAHHHWSPCLAEAREVRPLNRNLFLHGGLAADLHHNMAAAHALDGPADRAGYRARDRDC